MPSRPWPETDLYAITASQYSLGRSNPDIVRQLLESGIKVIQYREKELSARQKYQECLEIRRLTTQYRACFIVNDNIDIALAVKADGVHLGQADLPTAVARRIMGDKALIGLSTHSQEQYDQAVLSGMVDYIGVGPLFETHTKKDVQSPVGLGYLNYAIRRNQIPLVAIGGIKEHNLGQVVQHGASCVCLVTDIISAPDIPAKIAALRSIMTSSLNSHD
jgi:thiamine-phosphate pyrophosphorylase